MESLVSTKTQSWLSWFLKGVLFLGFLFLLARTAELTVIKGAYYRDLSEGNRIRRVPISAPRGRIFARGGEILAGASVVKKEIVFNPVEGFKKMDFNLAENPDMVIFEWKRFYPLGPKFVHVSGYLGQADASEVGKINPACPEKGPIKAGELIGRSGLEQQYDCLLRGVDGEELIEVDTQGRKVRVLGKRDPLPGVDIHTSIDYSLQGAVADIFASEPDLPPGRRGAVVALDPQGEVLALYSSPSFDPSVLTAGSDAAAIAKIFTDKNLPLLDRAIGGAYHPGSVFKPIVAAAALSEGKIDQNFVFNDTGVITIGKFSYSNWYFTQYGGVEGEIGVVRALARSTDTFFYKVGEMTGIDAIAAWAGKFGLGKETGIDIPGEVSGLVPTPAWKEEVKGEAWFLGNTYHVAIGQGDLTATPLQIAEETAVVANGGNFCQPTIFADGSTKRNCTPLGIKVENLDLVKEGMEGVCSPGGTGYTFFDFEIPVSDAKRSQHEPSMNNSEKASAKVGRVACKTGTAETNEDGKTHAWFTLFAPSENPEIIVTVLVEGGGEGSKVAGPIARKIMDYYFSKSEARSTKF
jgi:penicillin-binding protein 2